MPAPTARRTKSETSAEYRSTCPNDRPMPIEPATAHRSTTRPATSAASRTGAGLPPLRARQASPRVAERERDRAEREMELARERNGDEARRRQREAPPLERQERRRQQEGDEPEEMPGRLADAVRHETEDEAADERRGTRQAEGAQPPACRARPRRRTSAGRGGCTPTRLRRRRAGASTGRRAASPARSAAPPPRGGTSTGRRAASPRSRADGRRARSPSRAAGGRPPLPARGPRPAARGSGRRRGGSPATSPRARTRHRARVRTSTNERRAVTGDDGRRRRSPLQRHGSERRGAGRCTSVHTKEDP